MAQQLLSDLYQIWSTDLQQSNSGDIMPVTGTDRGKQRILRRLLTNPADPKVPNDPGEYIFDPTYGAGLRKYIGKNQDKGTLDRLQGIVQGQILQEAVVASTPAPVISIQQLPDFSLWVWIQYTDAATGVPVVLSFNVGND
jgi:hypothetical protein